MFLWGILVYDEIDYLQPLVERLLYHNKNVYVMYDVKSPAALKAWVTAQDVLYGAYAFDGDYSKMRNELDVRAVESGADWIFQLDVDELPTHDLIMEVEAIVKDSGYTMVNVCRQNLYSDISEEEKKRINYTSMGYMWPDPKPRIYKLDAGIKWEGRIHEEPSWDGPRASLPVDLTFCIVHEKTMARQEGQNQKYEEYQEHRDLAKQITAHHQWKRSILEDWADYPAPFDGDDE